MVPGASQSRKCSRHKHLVHNVKTQTGDLSPPCTRVLDQSHSMAGKEPSLGTALSPSSVGLGLPVQPLCRASCAPCATWVRWQRPRCLGTVSRGTSTGSGHKAASPTSSSLKFTGLPRMRFVRIPMAGDR